MSYSESRFYEKPTPDIDELVKVQVVRIEEHGAYCSLLEYDGIEGLLLISELSKRRIRSISKLIRVGQTHCCAVLRNDRGNIDLSKKRVSNEEAKLFEVKFADAKAVQSIMKHIASQLNNETEEVCKKVSWPLYRQSGHPIDALRRLGSSNGEDVVSVLRSYEGFSTEIETALVDVVTRKLTPQPVKIRADIEVSCFDYRGIDAVRTALLKGKEVSSADLQLSIRLVAPPQYMIVTNTLAKDEGFAAVESCMNIIKREIESLGGKFAVKQKPTIVGDDELEIDNNIAPESSDSSSDDDDSSVSDS